MNRRFPFKTLQQFIVPICLVELYETQNFIFCAFSNCEGRLLPTTAIRRLLHKFWNFFYKKIFAWHQRHLDIYFFKANCVILRGSVLTSIVLASRLPHETKLKSFHQIQNLFSFVEIWILIFFFWKDENYVDETSQITAQGIKKKLSKGFV